MDAIIAKSIPQLIQLIDREYARWDTEAAPWFRGEPGDVSTPLVPTVYRRDYDENNLLQSFRRYAPTRLERPPERDSTDDWLFLAQHFRLPTRLLDWTEGALIGLYFALQHDHPVLWMLNPLALAGYTTTDAVPNAFALTWWDPPGPVRNMGAANVKAAWGTPDVATDLPVPIHPTIIHPRMSVQLSCFTIFGMRRESLSRMVIEDCLVAFRLEMDRVEALDQLRTLGVRASTVFPDAEHLAIELGDLHRQRTWGDTPEGRADES